MSKRPILLHVWSSYYSAIARLVLIEKHVDYKSVIIDMHIGLEHFKPWYVALNHNATVPTLVHGKKTIPSSVEILTYVEKHFKGPSLVPKSPTLKKEMNDFLKEHHAIRIERFTMGTLLSKSPFMQKKLMSALNKQEPLCKAYTKAHPELKKAYDDKVVMVREHIHDFCKTHLKTSKASGEKQALHYLKRLEKRLTEKDWLLGEQYTLCDVVNTSFFARLEFIKRYDLLKNHPKCNAYWRRLQGRPSFKSARIPTAVRLHELVVGFFLGLCRKLHFKTTSFLSEK